MLDLQVTDDFFVAKKKIHSGCLMAKQGRALPAESNPHLQSKRDGDGIQSRGDTLVDTTLGRSLVKNRQSHQVGVVVHICNPSRQKAKEEGLPRDGGYPGLRSKFQASQGYIAWP